MWQFWPQNSVFWGARNCAIWEQGPRSIKLQIPLQIRYEHHIAKCIQSSSFRENLMFCNKFYFKLVTKSKVLHRFREIWASFDQVCITFREKLYKLDQLWSNLTKLYQSFEQICMQFREIVCRFVQIHNFFQLFREKLNKSYVFDQKTEWIHQVFVKTWCNSLNFL